MFEAIHGSAPRMIAEGKGHYANPQSILRATEMLLRHISFSREADLLAAALAETTGRDAAVVIDGYAGATCAEYTAYLTETLRRLLAR